MKGVLGLMIAAALGVVGAVCNWLYLQQLAADQATVDFLAIKQGVQLNIGDRIDEGDLEPVPLPESRAGSLKERAVLWSARGAIIGEAANRPFKGGELILEMDRERPTARNLAETLQADEVALWVQIDPRVVVTDQINPGDLVSFQVGGAARPNIGGSSAQPTPANGGDPSIHGPFRVLSIGNRRENTNVEQANRTRSASSGNNIAIVAKYTDGALDPEVARLMEAIRNSGSQGVGVLLHSSRDTR